MVTGIATQKLRLWLRWVIANALGELFGLGLTFVVIALVSSRLAEQGGAGPVLVSFVATVASGAIEATLVGLAQWWAMRPWFPTIGRSEWWRATLVGVLVAYGLGYLPSTLMSLGEPTPSAPVTEPPQFLILLLAAGLGVVAGAILALAQWLVLRRHVARAGLWLAGNMLAWLVGMPVIFWGMDTAFQRQSLAQALLLLRRLALPVALTDFQRQSLAQALLLLAGVLLLTGALVGTIHGVFLVRLAGPPARSQERAA